MCKSYQNQATIAAFVARRDMGGTVLHDVTRRTFIAAIGAAAVIPAAALRLAGAPTARAVALAAIPAPGCPRHPDYLFFGAAEARFIEAACERLIPADDSGPGALGARVPHYLDEQLRGEWGAGERPYRSGPWQPGSSPTQRRLRCAPAELFRTALSAIIRSFEARGSAFAALGATAQLAYLKSLEAGAADLDGVPSEAFFDMLLRMTIEGFFSHPQHGAGRDVVAWRTSGFPGACAVTRASSGRAASRGLNS